MSSMMDVDPPLKVKQETVKQEDQQRLNHNNSPFMIEPEDVKGVEDEDDDDTMDMAHLDRKVWLVKVPKFLADKWLNVEEADVELGRLRVAYDSKDPKKKKGDMVLHLEETDERYHDIPKQYNMSISKTEGLKNEFVFSENENRTAKAFEGTVIVESKIAPVVNDDYYRVMRNRTEMAKAKDKSRSVKLIDDRAEKQVFMLQSSGPASLAARSRIELKPKRAETNRKERLPREELINLLFRCFARYEYWNLKGLIEETSQPQQYLKEVLSDIAINIKRGPYVGKWQLRPELRVSNDEEQQQQG